MKRFFNAIAWPAAAAMVMLLGPSAHAQEVEIIDVRPPAPARDQPAAVEATKQAAPSYWIGILGGDVSPELRAHLGLEGAGVLVREVVPESPAADGGLRQFDVLLTANGKPVTDMGVLATEVQAVGGKQDGKIVLELLRTGAHKQLTIVPAERPANPPIDAAPAPEVGDAPGGAFGDGFGFGAGEGGPFQFRLFGPGIALGGANVNVQANGTSVKVQTNDGKTSVEVTRDGDTWEFDADDPEALEQLPEDVRPMVEGVLNNRQQVGVNVDLQGMLPQLQGVFERFGENRAERVDARLRRQIERMERQLEAMRRELAGEPAAAAGEAAEEAPAFEPPAPPAELELPAEEVEVEIEEK